jgi:hypothetical protein
MIKFNIKCRLALSLILIMCGNVAAFSQIQFSDFQRPPKQAEPWVYWMWVNGNATINGVNKDLEAMNRVGINGAIILDVDQGSPNGKATFGNELWRKVYHNTVQKAGELGMKIGINNGPGYFGSGGTWVKPEMALQWVVSSETYIDGGGQWKGNLKSPGMGSDYHDIAVIAIHRVDTTNDTRYTINDIVLKTIQNPGSVGVRRYSAAPFTQRQLNVLRFPGYIGYRGVEAGNPTDTAPARAIIPLTDIVDVTDKMDADGNFAWDVPQGKWTIIRFGHQWTGSCIGPVIPQVRGAEIDRLNPAATQLHFDSIVKPLKEWADNPALVIMHTDSWEGGGMNWTHGFEKIFKEKRGYDILPWLPVLTGRVVGSLQQTERFMQDLRYTVNELFLQNYSSKYKALMNGIGLKFSGETYTSPANDMDVSNFDDIPMCEFWLHGYGPDFEPTQKLMSSVAQVNGRKIVAAEALTANPLARWRYHPALMKADVDRAFTRGVNRLVFHRYSQQNIDNYPGPGNQMNMWGCKYERTNTWWEYSKPWHEYIARCQEMLQTGTVRADVLALQTEEPGRLFNGLKIKGYDYTVLGSEVFKKLTADEKGLYLPGRPAYKLLLLPQYAYMSVEMLSKIRDLVNNGAVILGNPPKTVPGLNNYREREVELKQIVDELWGSDTTVTQRKVGKGTVLRGIKPEEALTRIGLSPDFTANCDLESIHLTNGDVDYYFVANITDKDENAVCQFRVKSKTAQLWDAETGKRYSLDVQPTGTGVTANIPFKAKKSWFIVFGVPADKNLVAYREKTPLNVTEVKGAWDVSFLNGLGAPARIIFPKLTPWNENNVTDIKYYSGTARYTKSINVEKSYFNKSQSIILDLGKVEVIARLKVNGKDMGIAWKTPFNFDVTSALKPGVNKLEIDVVNLWPNRLIGDEQYPDDIGYFQVPGEVGFTDGTMKAWPAWLVNGTPRPVKERKVFTARKQWTKDEPLLPSGLLGPVTLYNQK